MAFDVLYMEGFDDIGTGDTRLETHFDFSSQSAFAGLDINASDQIENGDVAAYNQGNFPKDQYVYHSPLLGGETTVFLSLWVYFWNGSLENFRLFEGGQWQKEGQHVSVRLNADNLSVEAFRGDPISGGTSLGSNVFAVNDHIWHHLEIKVVLHATTGSVEVRIDGAVALNLTSKNTIGAGLVGEINGFLIQGASGGQNNRYLHISDLVLQGASGDWLGKHRIKTYLPTADGATTSFTPNSGAVNYDRVDETSIDQDTTYNQSTTSTNRDRLGFANPSFVEEAVAVGVKVIANRQKVGETYLKVGIRGEAGTEDLSTGELPRITTRYNPIQHIAMVNPEDSLAWEATDLDAAELVYEIV